MPAADQAAFLSRNATSTEMSTLPGLCGLLLRGSYINGNVSACPYNRGPTLTNSTVVGTLTMGCDDLSNAKECDDYWGTGDPTWMTTKHCEQHHCQLPQYSGTGCSGTLNSGGFNLLATVDGCTIEGDTTGNLIGVDPQLEAPADNGGPTLTSALRAGSPAIDPGSPSSCEAADQRGVARPQGATCDMGAYEFACGNGVVDLGEACDDGNTLDGDCCSADCQVEPAGTICRPVGGDCDVAETCDGVASACPADDSPVCPTVTATTTPTPTGTPTATPTGYQACAPIPQANCKTPSVPQKSTLTLKDKTKDATVSLTWQWLKGSPTSKLDFGSPDVTTDYALCVYDAGSAPRLVLSAAIPAGQLCGSKKPKPCWKPTKAGFQYKDSTGSADGVHTIVLQSGEAPGRAKIVVAGKGIHLEVPNPLSLVPPVTVQLATSDGRCWEATYSLPAKVEASEFKGKADPTPLPRATRTPGRPEPPRQLLGPLCRHLSPVEQFPPSTACE